MSKVSAEVYKEHPLQSMCTYLGGFPPRVPRSILQSLVPARSTVLDPFCGAGTTLLEAKLSGRPAIGVDKNPLAVALASARVANVDLAEVDARIDDLARGYPGESAMEPDSDNIRIIYHPRTLSQLCYLRQALDLSRDSDVFLQGAVLGIMHGKMKKDGTTSYLSIDMPNTFSMSPEYVRSFVGKHNLVQPPVDVFRQVRRRVRWLLRSGPLAAAPQAVVIEGDATNLRPVLARHGVKSVGAVVTSPPYLGVLRYGAYNWIRLWFLGKSQQQVDRALDTTDSMDVYLSFMASLMGSLAEVTRPGALVALVIGDVVERGQYVALSERIWEEVRGLFPFAMIHNQADCYDMGTKTTRIWGEGRKGKATPKDSVLLLRRVRSDA